MTLYLCKFTTSFHDRLPFACVSVSPIRIVCELVIYSHSAYPTCPDDVVGKGLYRIILNRNHRSHIYFPRMRAPNFPQLAVSCFCLVTYLGSVRAQETTDEPEVGVYDWGCGES